MRSARRGGGIFAAEEGTEDGEAGGEDADVAFDNDPDADANGGVGCVGDLEFGEEGDPDDAGYADATWSESVHFKALSCLVVERGKNRGTYKLPKTKSPTTAIRLGTAMFMPHSQGIGNIRTTRSVTTLTEVIV